jgi:hypothetical protein
MQRQSKLLSPAEEIAHRPGIGSPGVRVANIGGEEFKEGETSTQQISAVQVQMLSPAQYSTPALKLSSVQT